MQWSRHSPQAYPPGEMSGQADRANEAAHSQEAQAAQEAHPAANTTAFFTLLAQYEEIVLRMAVAMVGQDAAEDVAQEAITHAWQAWPTLRDTSSAGAWLLRITGNVCRMWRRGAGVRKRLTQSLDSLDEAQGLHALIGDGAGWGAQTQVEAFPGDSDHARALDVRQVVTGLDDDLRLIVVLRFYVGMDSIAIGESLGVSPATVRTRLRRAMGVLRERLGIPLERPQLRDEQAPLFGTQRPEGRS